jgi:serine/threonine protein kinase
LHELLHSKETKLNRLQKTNIALRIAQGMNFIHLSKIIHRDLVRVPPIQSSFSTPN